MRINSMQREEPYQGLTYTGKVQRCAPRKVGIQVVHGCRQLVSWHVGLSPATSASLVLCCQHVMVGTHRRLPGSTRRKVGMTSNHHAPYVQGFTHATMAGTKGCDTVRWSESQKAGLSSDRGLQLDPVKSKTLVIADQQRCGEYVPGPCTHRPSRPESRQHPKPVAQPLWREPSKVGLAMGTKS